MITLRAENDLLSYQPMARDGEGWQMNVIQHLKRYLSVPDSEFSATMALIRLGWGRMNIEPFEGHAPGTVMLSAPKCARIADRWDFEYFFVFNSGGWNAAFPNHEFFDFNRLGDLKSAPPCPTNL